MFSSDKSNMTHTIAEQNIAFIDHRERIVAEQAIIAVTALAEAASLKRELALPPLLETRATINGSTDLAGA